MIAPEKSETICSKRFEALGAEIFYARTACGSGDLCAEDRRQIKLKLARRISIAMGAKSGPQNGFWFSRDLALNIRSDYLGKPTLELLGRGDFSISFSYGPGEVWGAIVNGNLTCGIDVAFPKEFLPPYPLQRAFGDRELELLCSANNFSLSEAAGFAWSAKESFIKSLGIGFNLCDPLDICLTGVQPCEEYFQSYFSIAPGLKSKLGIQTAIPFQTMTRPESPGFLSLSVVKRFGCLDWYQTLKSVHHPTAGLSQ